MLVCYSQALQMKQRRNLYASEFVKISWHGIVVFVFKAQRYNKKCTYASKTRNYFQKKIDLDLSQASSARIGSLLTDGCWCLSPPSLFSPPPTANLLFLVLFPPNSPPACSFFFLNHNANHQKKGASLPFPLPPFHSTFSPPNSPPACSFSLSYSPS